MAHETVISDNRYPLWIKRKVKKVINGKNKEHKKYNDNKSNFLLWQSIDNLQTQIKILIDTMNYFSSVSEKLKSTSINTNCYWSLLKSIT